MAGCVPPGGNVSSESCDLRRAALLTRRLKHVGARGSSVGSGTTLQAGKSRVPSPMRSLDFSIYLNLPAALGLGVHSACNRNEYQQSNRGVERGRCVRLTTSPPSMIGMSRKRVRLDVSKPYRTPWPLQGQLTVQKLMKPQGLSVPTVPVSAAYFAALSVSRPVNWKRFGRNRRRPTRNTIPAFS
jgi:hypothetical protein